MRIPELVRRMEDSFPAKGGAPEAPPLPEISLLWEKRERKTGRGWLGYVLALAAGAAGSWLAITQGWVG